MYRAARTRDLPPQTVRLPAGTGAADVAPSGRGGCRDRAETGLFGMTLQGINMGNRCQCIKCIKCIECMGYTQVSGHCDFKELN